MALEPFDLGSLKFPCKILIAGPVKSGKSYILRHILSHTADIPRQGHTREYSIKELFKRRGEEEVISVIHELERLEHILVKDLARMIAEYAQSWYIYESYYDMMKHNARDSTHSLSCFSDGPAENFNEWYMKEKVHESFFITTQQIHDFPSWPDIIIICGLERQINVFQRNDISQELHIPLRFLSRTDKLVYVRSTQTCFYLPYAF